MLKLTITNFQCSDQNTKLLENTEGSIHIIIMVAYRWICCSWLALKTTQKYKQTPHTEF